VLLNTLKNFNNEQLHLLPLELLEQATDAKLSNTIKERKTDYRRNKGNEAIKLTSV
jgi:hypothetical protein